METRTIQFIAESCGGRLAGLDPGRAVSRISIDSRTLEPGDLFVAVSGDRFDGHDFIGEVLQKGAAGVIAQEGRYAGPQAILVRDPRIALGAIARRYRRDFDLWAIAIAGSNGKTSAKELLGSVLASRLPVVSSPASFNNDIGVPLTLLRLSRDHRAGVFEAGTNHPGELKPLVEMIQPSIGVITSIGREHLEFFGDLEGVLREEGELAEALPPGGLLIIDGDGYGADALRRRSAARVARIGFQPGNDWRISEVHYDLEGTHFCLTAPDQRYSGSYHIRLLGAHQALNAAYAVVAAAELGLSKPDIEAGLTSCLGAKMRLQLRKIDDFLILDDAYNANADSVSAALETLARLPCPGRRIAVLGDMAELGSAGALAHEEVGRRAAERQIDCLVTVGCHASLMADAARTAGLQDVRVSAGAEDAGPAVERLIRPGDMVLVKASRASRLERVVDYLAQRFGEDQ